jgi:hypothetical protein
VGEPVPPSRYFCRVFQLSDFLLILLGPAFAKPAGHLYCGASAREQMQNEKHYAHDENDVNKSSRDVKCKKPK